MLRHERQDQVRADGRDLIEARFAIFAFDVIFRSKAETAMRLDACVATPLQ